MADGRSINSTKTVSADSGQNAPTAQPTISVILPNYNHGKWLRRAVGALVAQADPAMEIVLVDDGSTDNSLEVISALCRRYDCIRFRQHEVNRGAHAAVRTGIAAAGGEFILFSAADDFVLPGLLSRAVAALRANPEAAFFCSEVALADCAGHIFDYRPILPPRLDSGYVSPGEMRRNIRHTDNWFVGTSLIYRRRLLADIGYFDETLGTLCDGLATRLLAFRHGFYFDANILAVCMIDPTTLSAQTSLSDTESRRVIDAGVAWIIDRFPGDVRDSYAPVFRRRFAFNMARQRLLWPNRQVDPEALCDLLDFGRSDRLAIRSLCRLPFVGRTAALVFLTLRLRPLSLIRLARSRWRVRVRESAARAALKHRLEQAWATNNV